MSIQSTQCRQFHAKRDYCCYNLAYLINALAARRSCMYINTPNIYKEDTQRRYHHIKISPCPVSPANFCNFPIKSVSEQTLSLRARFLNGHLSLTIARSNTTLSCSSKRKGVTEFSHFAAGKQRKYVSKRGSEQSAASLRSQNLCE